MRILYNDLVSAVMARAGGERSGFPAANVQHPHLSRVWRSLTAAAQYVVIDAGVGLTMTADSAAVVAHNFTPTAAVLVQGNDTDSWATPSLERSGDPADPLILITFPSAAYRFWRFYVDDPANSDGYIQIGRLFLCARWDAVEQIDSGLVRDVEDATMVSRSITGQKFADLGPRARIYECSMGTMKDETRESLETIADLVGAHTPVITIPNDKLDPLYCTLEKQPRFTQAGGWLWKDDGLRFMEAF